ncbi:methyltransferase domain-containing protein [Adhaeribacter soli]|uniref:Methyltransferase domain-containing protein n=1 Tax=Adhaeribacter soli TaxID=2607655 RepID=A0A5N1II08_9BACT|nr:methyltransferase domain-containing protein [Adhaeribacter soli]KAA9325028.1 methyltransferase domain-containing protein [Adhaeribacter soli]
MFETRSTEAEIMDDLSLGDGHMRKTLDELETINTWLGGYQVIRQSLNKLLPAFREIKQPISVADLGCGGGDTLRETAKWAQKRNLSLALTGIDANAYILEYAAQKCQAYPNIHFQQHDVFSEDFRQQRYHVVMCSLFCHHFPDEQLIRLFRQCYNQAAVAVIINDLHRHPLAYYSIKILTKLFSRSPMVKNDGPLSVLRAFRRKELVALLEAAGINKYELRWKWAFRWQLILYK